MSLHSHKLFFHSFIFWTYFFPTWTFLPLSSFSLHSFGPFPAFHFVISNNSSPSLFFPRVKSSLTYLSLLSHHHFFFTFLHHINHFLLLSFYQVSLFLHLFLSPICSQLFLYCRRCPSPCFPLPLSLFSSSFTFPRPPLYLDG